MKAVVTGGNGFIGSHLVDRLADTGWEVWVLDNRSRQYDQPSKAVRWLKGDYGQNLLLMQAAAGADVVFHLAWSTIHESSNDDPVADVQQNLASSIRLLQTGRQLGVKKIVFLSSAGTVYGIPEHLPVKESHPTNPISAYGITKLAVEKYLQMFHQLDQQDYAIIRPTVPYGPRQNPLRRQGAVAVFLYRVANGLPVSIWGDGKVGRDFFFVSDLVDAMIAAAQNPLSEHRLFNIGGEREVTLVELLAKIEEVVGVKANVDWQPARSFDVPRMIVDTSLARSALKWKPRTSLEEGLLRTWVWMSGMEDSLGWNRPQESEAKVEHG